MANHKTFASMIGGGLGVSMGASIGQAAEKAMPWYLNSFNAEDVSGLYYQYFLMNNEHCLTYAHDRLLENAASYAVDKNLKRKMYGALRDNKVFRKGRRSVIFGFIANEIIAIFGAFKSAYKYIKYTVKMYRA